MIMPQENFSLQITTKCFGIYIYIYIKFKLNSRAKYGRWIERAKAAEARNSHNNAWFKCPKWIADIAAQ